MGDFVLRNIGDVFEFLMLLFCVKFVMPFSTIFSGATVENNKKKTNRRNYTVNNTFAFRKAIIFKLLLLSLGKFSALVIKSNNGKIKQKLDC